MRGNSFWAGSGLILVGATCFGFQSSLVKTLLALGSNPFQVIFYELATASLVLGGALLVIGRSLIPMPLRDAAAVLFWGAIGVGGTGLALYGAVERIPVALAIVLLFYYIPWVFFLEFLFLKIKPTRRRWIALAMILAGTVLASDLLAVSLRGFDITGIALGLVSGVCYGTFIFGVRGLGGAGTPLGRSFTICAGTLLIVGAGGLFNPGVVFMPPRGETVLFFGLIVAVALLGQVIPLLAFSRAIPLIGGSLAAIIASVELPVACLVAWVFLGEHLSAWQWFGIFLITLAVTVANWRRRELRGVLLP